MTQSQQSTDSVSNRETGLRRAFLEEVNLIPDGERIRQCIQCGTCTGSCPVSYAMDISPRRVIALYRAGELEPVLRSNTIWMCASCYACTVRCPVGIRITDLMYAFKRVAKEQRLHPKHLAAHALSSSFLRIVNRYGRNHEVLLLLWYAMRTNPLKLIPMIPLGWRLRSKGRIPLAPKGIRNRKQLAGIIRLAVGDAEVKHKAATA
jgi:heterodisulfide reductase subunit C